MMKKNCTAALIFLLLFPFSGKANAYGMRPKNIVEKEKLPPRFRTYIGEILFDRMGNEKGDVQIRTINDNTLYVKFTFDPKDSVGQDDWQLNIKPAFAPSFHWAPHLTPADNYIIAQHVFRSPALIFSNEDRSLTLIPDLDILKRGTPVDWYMDMDAQKNIFTLGMSRNKVTDHVLFERDSGAVYPEGKLEIGCYLICSNDGESLCNPFRKPLEFLWTRWGKTEFDKGNPIGDNDLEPYVKHTYRWAFESWGKSVWQKFQLGGKKVGAPVFIVNVTQSPNYPGNANEREFRSVWNQAWFSSLRSASGLYRYGRKKNDPSWIEKANLTKELALSAPQINGFFPALIATEMEEVEIDGQKYNRSSGWNSHYWGNSNRNPYTWDAKESPYHVLDMSWTALLMLRWYEDLEKDERLLSYARQYADALLKIQTDDGFFPGWLNLHTLLPMQHLNQSPETSMSVTFLLKLYELTGKEHYKNSALKAMDAVVSQIIPEGRWEDFETYWSCSRYGSTDLVGKKIARNNMYKQCNFSMFWTTEALFECYRITKSKEYLRLGRRTLDEMLMTQASWQPPYMYVNVLGGFGVMNADGEWNDSRQSLFAEIILQYGKLLNVLEYKERGIAALKASFVMMYCPENPITKKQWEKAWPFFGSADYGFTMENYGHGGKTSPRGLGMGEFTIYDWGNGAAAEAYNRITDKFGEIK